MRGSVVVAEKPSVAKAISKVLNSIGEDDVLVTSVKGHLLDLDLPIAFRNWKGRDPVEVLELALSDLRYVVRDSDSYRNLLSVFKERAPLVIATDNDHEGELIGAEILMVYRKVRGDRSRYFRMRFNSVDEEELLRAWRNLEPDLNWRWVYKAEFRRAFDLLTGAAFTRFLTLSAEKKGFDGLLSWGSCQTPTLYFVVERDLQIENFKPVPFWYLEAVLETSRGERLTARTERFWEKAEALERLSRATSSEFAVVRDWKEEEVGGEEAVAGEDRRRPQGPRLDHRKDGQGADGGPRAALRRGLHLLSEDRYEPLSRGLQLREGGEACGRSGSGAPERLDEATGSEAGQTRRRSPSTDLPDQALHRTRHPGRGMGVHREEVRSERLLRRRAGDQAGRPDRPGRRRVLNQRPKGAEARLPRGLPVPARSRRPVAEDGDR
jgi:hypothetical protein